jgi:site-specific DNA-methyltransferase (adenine-specific)
MTSGKNDLIYDPMAGSGTTGVVCKIHKRKCIVSDISDEYLTLAEKRLGIKRLSQDIIKEQLFKIA